MKRRKRTKPVPGRKPGRPKGSKNKTRQVVAVVPPRCKKCGSTDRTPYMGHRRVMQRAGTAPDGKPYNRITWRDTKCLACNQVRVDLIYENVPETNNG